MADNTHIEWADATWNPITGCSVISPGCTNCYAMRLAGTRLKNHPSRSGLTVETRAGPVWNGKVRLNEEWLGQPLHWRRPRNIFVGAHTDLFHPSIPNVWLDVIFGVMAAAHWHTFQVLTKRSERMLQYLSDERTHRFVERLTTTIPHPTGRRPLSELVDAVVLAKPLPNVWLGVSAEDQERFDERVGHLRRTPAAIRFISFEPLLGAISAAGRLDGIHWAIAGGENGPRPTHPAWVRRLRDDCAGDGVAFFLKQWGSWVAEDQAPPDTAWGEDTTPRHAFADGQEVWKLGKRWTGRLLDGVEHNAMPMVAP